MVDAAQMSVDGLTGVIHDVHEDLLRITEVLAGRDESQAGGGRVTAPAVGARIATAGIVPRGRYEIEVTVGTGPGAVAADVGNVELRFGSQVILAGMGGGLPPVTYKLERRLDGETEVAVYATAAGTAGVVYSAVVAATRVE